jgi:CubicO group peptidase (beta-lactamase class C family)
MMLLNNGELDGVRILSRKSVELMRTARTDWDDDSLADFGLGFQVVSDLGKAGEIGSVGSYSWGGAFDPTPAIVHFYFSRLI